LNEQRLFFRFSVSRIAGSRKQETSVEKPNDTYTLNHFGCLHFVKLTEIKVLLGSLRCARAHGKLRWCQSKDVRPLLQRPIWTRTIANEMQM